MNCLKIIFAVVATAFLLPTMVSLLTTILNRKFGRFLKPVSVEFTIFGGIVGLLISLCAICFDIGFAYMALAITVGVPVALAAIIAICFGFIYLCSLITDLINAVIEPIDRVFVALVRGSARCSQTIGQWLANRCGG
jgi:hypothetical protein